MHRIDTTNKAVDLFGAGKHGWKDGNKALGIVPTEFNAAIMNMLQEELVGIVEAAGITLDPNNRAQLLTALRSAGVFQTAAQFDTSTKAATMEAVQRALGSRSGIKEISTATALGTIDAGKLVIFTAGSSPATLPALSSVVPGTEFEFFGAVAATNSVSRAGADVIYVNNTTVTSFNIGQGSTARVVARATGWALVGGTANLINAQPEFGALISASGYQKLPSGLIVQWVVGSTVSGVNAAQQSVTLPITFPSATLFAHVGTKLASGNGGVSVWNHLSSGAGQVTCYCTAAGTPNDVAPIVIAIGY